MNHIKDQPPPWWWDLLKILAVFYVLTCLFGCTHQVNVVIHPGLPEWDVVVLDEIYAALDYVQEREGLDRDAWEGGLRIEVFDEHLGVCGEECVYLGLYWHNTAELWVQWDGGTCHNALIHELYHRVSYLKGHSDGMFGGPSKGLDHGTEFQEKYYPALNSWLAKRRCIW